MICGLAKGSVPMRSGPTITTTAVFRAGGAATTLALPPARELAEPLSILTGTGRNLDPEARSRPANFSAMRFRFMCVLAVAGAFFAGCGGGGGNGGEVTRTDLIAWLEGESGNDPEQAKCVADKMLDAGLTQAELREFVVLDADVSKEDYEEPSQIDVYTQASLDCVLSQTSDALR